MGYVLRNAYFVGNTPRAISQKAFERFLDPSSNEILRDVTDERVRLAAVVLVSEKRTIVELVKEDYSIVTVDGAGRLDQRAWDQTLHDAVNLLDLPKPGDVVDASSRFAYARHTWKPSSEQRRALFSLWKLPTSWISNP